MKIDRAGARTVEYGGTDLAEYHATLDDAPASPANVPLAYAWAVFALTFGLLISDYMSRQVLNAVFPLLKTEWALSDARLGSLSGVVSLMVGLLTFPLSLLAEFLGRVRSLTVMAVLWSLATLGCAVSKSFDQMLLARFFVGVGEAAYGSVGIALVLSVFPAHMRATLTGAFMAGGTIGSVLGIALGGAAAAAVGWRGAFAAMAVFGFALACVFPVVVRETRVVRRPKPTADAAGEARPSLGRRLTGLVGSRSVLCAYVGSGLQLFISGAVIAWMPSYLNRYYGMSVDRAGVTAAGLVCASGAGMVLWGMASDRLSRRLRERKTTLAFVLCLLSLALLAVAFRLPAGRDQLLLIAAGLFVAAGTTGPAGAVVAELTHPSVHGAAFATLTLANNLLGLAPGPFVTGALGDALGLDVAFRWVPLVSVGSALAFLALRRSWRADLARASGETSRSPSAA
jgi:MFS family permease